MDKDLTSMFIQFAEEYFTDSAADRLHNPFTISAQCAKVPQRRGLFCNERVAG